MALAKSLGLDIMTDATHVHEVVAGQSEEDVLGALLGDNLRTKKAPATDDTVYDLAEIVVRTAFDVRVLTAKQVGQRLADGHDLRRFNNASYPSWRVYQPSQTSTSTASDWKRQLPTCLKEWKKYKKSLPGFALDALVETAELEWPTAPGFARCRGNTLGRRGSGRRPAGAQGRQGARRLSRTQERSYRYLSTILTASAHTQTALSIAPPR